MGVGLSAVNESALAEAYDPGVYTEDPGAIAAREQAIREQAAQDALRDD